jgi:glycosyltransferase involved in cell wall biosynthesis
MKAVHLKLRVQLILKSVASRGGFSRVYKKVVFRYRHEGFSGLKRALNHLAAHELKDNHNPGSMHLLQPVKVASESLFFPRVLIIAEMSIPQCKKYRVVQKKQLFEKVGIECTILDWRHHIDCLNALSSHSLVIFYRMPAFPATMDFIHEANRLNVRTLWEVDDLIFDREVLINSKTLSQLHPDVLGPLIEGATLYKQAMLACDEGIASTSGLADAMRAEGVPLVSVVENALDQQTLKAAETHVNRGTIADDWIRIVYGSGTNTHNVDFAEAADAILDIMKVFPQVKFRLIGLLELPKGFEQFTPRIERIDFCEYDAYLGYLSECDISIAPLENYIFNEAKSNIKFLEASIVKVPSVCSPRSAYTSVIVDGENGLLAETFTDWNQALARLVKSTELRSSLAEAAYKTVLDRYMPVDIAQTQLAPLLKTPTTKKSTKKILSVNVYYSPDSFGGATIVAEQVNSLLHQMDGFEVSVFTTIFSGAVPNYSMRRYRTDGLNIFAVSLPANQDTRSQFDNPHVADHFEQVLAAVKPDLVHLHCIQGLGVALADRCLEKGIPYYITLHDAWWLCGRQFMLDRTGAYCNQEVIDSSVCAGCVEEPMLHVVRQKRLKGVLDNAEQLLAPSEFFAGFYRNNGFPGDQVIVNKNGVMRPRSATARVRQTGPVRFGYVGGNTRVKGFHLVEKVFRSMGEEVQLKVVDNMLSLGVSSYDNVFPATQVNVEIIPAYSQDNIDHFFSSIDVLLFPTQWKESFGLTVREAIARDVWVIVTAAGGVTEDIVEGVNGEIIPFNDRGDALKSAVTNAVKRFESIEIGAPISWDSANITWFKDQADELAKIFSKI